MKITTEDKKIFTKIRHNVKTCKIHYKNAISLVKEINCVPNENEAIYIWLQGNFIFGDFIIQYITENDLFVDELTIITLSITQENISAITELISEKWVKDVNLMLSGYFLRTEKAKHTQTAEILQNAVSDNFKVFYSSTHQKITLLKLSDGRKIVMHGSANMKGSQNFEQLMIENNNDLYDFNYEYFKNLI